MLGAISRRALPWGDAITFNSESRGQIADLDLFPSSAQPKFLEFTLRRSPIFPILAAFLPFLSLQRFAHIIRANRPRGLDSRTQNGLFCEPARGARLPLLPATPGCATLAARTAPTRRRIVGQSLPRWVFFA